MKMSKIIFIYQNLHDIIDFIKQHKIKHGPMNKAVHYIEGHGHACEIYDVEHLAMLNLGFGDSFRIIRSNERFGSYGNGRRVITLDMGD